MNAPAQMLQDVSDEGTAVRSGVNAVNGDTIRAMIWATAENARVNPAEIILPPGTVLPLWNTAPATDITEPACSLISAPPGADTTPPQPGEAPPGETWAPPGETWTPPKTGETWGKDLAPDGTKPVEKILEDLDKPGTPGSKDALTLALEQITADLPTTPIEAGLSTGTMVAIGVGAVAVIALIAVVAMRSGKASGGTKRRRRNPSKRRAR